MRRVNKALVSAQIMHTQGNQLVPEFLMKLSDTLHTQSGIFLPIYPGPIQGPVPNAKKYIFFPILMKKFPI